MKFPDQTSSLRPLYQRTRGGTYPNNTYLLMLQSVKITYLLMLQRMTITYLIIHVVTQAAPKQETYLKFYLLLRLPQKHRKRSKDNRTLE